MRSILLAGVVALAFASAANAQLKAPKPPSGPYTWDAVAKRCQAANGQSVFPSFCPLPHCAADTVKCGKVCIGKDKVCRR